MVEGEAFSSGFENLSSGGLSESEGGNGKLWYVKKSNVISHG